MSYKEVNYTLGVALFMVTVTSLVILAAVYLDKQSNITVFSLPKPCETVIKVDQDVKQNIKDGVVLGGTNKIIQGKDEWFNNQLKECKKYFKQGSI